MTSIGVGSVLARTIPIRSLASLLIAAFSFPLIAAVTLADTASKLPACCRRNGKHHCAISTGGTPADGPAVTASQTKCPLFPGTSVVPVGSKTILLSAVQRVGAQPLCGFTSADSSHHPPHIASRGAIQKRGPPTFAWNH